jgi:hypothetical protein
LSGRSRRIWAEVLAIYRLEEADKRTLESALRMLDRADSARSEIERDGITFADRFGQRREHPAVATERQAVLAAARLFRELGIGADIPEARIPRARDYK